MKKNLTELVFILDESGSMAPLIDDTIGGFNSLIEKQKSENGEAFVSTIFFNNSSKVVHDRLRLDDVSPITRKDYTPSGCTALLDAVGNAIHHIATIHKYAREEDVPEKTLFVITTDGMENASRRYDLAAVKSMIERQKNEYGWEFIFLGANIDAVGVAGSMGISGDNAVDFRPDAAGTSALYESVSCAVGSVRAGAPLGKSWRNILDKDNKRRK